MAESKPSEHSSIEGPFPCLFGGYVLVNHLGEGGMGRVYLALTRDEHGEHLYVVKRFGNPRARFSPAQILENQERFRHEADVTKALRHPCIARTFSSVDQGPASYLVQEFIHGLTLDYLISLMHPQQMPVPLAAHIVTQIAEALHYVHEFRGMGLIHRDLTAENVMFSRAGEVKVIDFGIAKATLLDETLTKPNIVVGKPLWTAPEVAEGAKPDRRADLYALGMLFWHLLCGQTPEGHLDETHPTLPPPSTFNPEVAPHLDRIVAKALDPNPNHRFQTAQEFLHLVTPLIPDGYQGAKELARLVVGYDLVREMDYFNARVAEARPLLEQICPTPKPFSIWKVFLIAIISAAAALAIGSYLLLGSRSTTHQDVLPPSRIPPSSAASSSPTPSPIPPPPVPLPIPTSPPQLPEALSEAPVLKPQASSPPHQPRPRTTKARLLSTPHVILEEHPSPDPAPEELLASALEAIDRSQLSQALDLAKLAATHGAGAKAYILIARVLSLKQDPAGAQDALETALRLSPGNRQATRLLEDLKQRNP